MSWKSFVENYFTNLFILWEIVMLVTDICKNNPILDSFRTILWQYQGYLVVLFPLVMVGFYYDVKMLTNNKEFISKIKGSKTKSSLVFFSIIPRIMTDIVLFIVGIIIIIAEQHSEIIVNKQIFEFWVTVGYIVIIVLPIVHYITLWSYKRSLSLKTDFEHNRFKISLLPIAFWVCMLFVGSLAYVSIDYVLVYLK